MIPADIEARLELARAGRRHRLRATGSLALRMMFHDKPQLIGTVIGVVFAVVLANQQLGVLFGLLQKNTMLVDNAAADIWVCPPGTNQVQPGKRLKDAALQRARTTPGVAQAAPMVYQTGSVQRPSGGAEAVTLIGVSLPERMGYPWNVVVGDVESLTMPRAMFFEDDRREKMGGLNLGSTREVNGVKVQAVGFTWGLMPFGPPYVFGELKLIRAMTNTPDGEQHFILVRVAEGASADAVRDALQARLPDTKVMTQAGFTRTIQVTLLGEQLGITFGTSTAFGLIIGFIIVALSMFSSVIDNLREFGTLKAVGASNAMLTTVIVVQSIGYALLGSFFGLGVVSAASEGIRSAGLSMIIPWQLIVLTPIIMTVLCVLASTLALRRVRKLEPGMVFR